MEMIKKERTIRVTSFFVLAVATMFVRELCLMFRFVDIAEILFLLLAGEVFCLALFCFTAKVFYDNDRQTKKLFLFSFLIIVCIFLVWGINLKFKLIVEGYNALGIIIIMPILASAKSFSWSKKGAKLIILLIKILSVLFLLSCFFSVNYNEHNELCLWYQNPNQAGLKCLLLFLLNLLFLKIQPNKNGTDIFFVIFCLVPCFLTRSITCIICILLCLTFSLVTKMKIVKVRTIFYVSALAPIYMPLCFNLLIKLFPIAQASLLIRSQIFEEAIQEIFSDIFNGRLGQTIGNFSDYYGTILNAHNTLLQIAWDYSIIVALLFVFFCVEFFKLLNNEQQNNIGCVLCVCFFHMSMEYSILTAAIDYSLLFVLIVVFTLNSNIKSLRK